MTARIAPAALKARLEAGEGELALIDVREPGAFARGHLLFASNMPLSRLEIEAPRLVPRRATPIVLCDGGGDLAARAAERLAGFGYGDLALLDGGVEGWRAAGFELFEGVHVPSKGFGEFVEAGCGTPNITPEALARLRDAGADMVILDSRPAREFRRMSLPGAINLPGAELVHSIRDLAPEPDRLIVVNCAGRTRGIIGAQSLINAGVENRVVALENGTMGWSLAGFALDHGRQRTAGPPSKAARAWAKAAATRIAQRFGVITVDHATLARWRDEAWEQTLYLLDVRTPEEYLAGHLAGARSAPGGQLVQAIDGYIGTLGGRILLVDDDGVRATMTASWLIQMGRANVFVLEGGLGEADLEVGPSPPEVLGLEAAAEDAAMDVSALADRLPGGDLALFDLADSRGYEAGHIPGAWYVSRARLAEGLARIPAAASYVLTSPDGLLARLAAAELGQLLRAPVRVLSGGTEAWAGAGLPLGTGPEHMACEPDDVYRLPYDHDPDQVIRRMRDYLAWETGLPARIRRDGTARFTAFPA